MQQLPLKDSLLHPTWSTWEKASAKAILIILYHFQGRWQLLGKCWKASTQQSLSINTAMQHFIFSDFVIPPARHSQAMISPAYLKTFLWSCLTQHAFIDFNKVRNRSRSQFTWPQWIRGHRCGGLLQIDPEKNTLHTWDQKISCFFLAKPYLWFPAMINQLILLCCYL